MYLQIQPRRVGNQSPPCQSLGHWSSRRKATNASSMETILGPRVIIPRRESNPAVIERYRSPHGHRLTFVFHSLIADPKNQALYTNRAMARLKLELWDAVVSDCQDALALNPESMKASYYLSQALLPLRDFDGAVTAALHAHAKCVETGDRSLAAVTAQVLRCKKERWEHKEKVRIRESQYLEQETLEMMSGARDRALEAAQGEAERDELVAEWENKLAELKSVFEKSRTKDQQRREVPDWVIDDISFGIMVDPVIVSVSHAPVPAERHDLTFDRRSRASHTSEHPSWSTCAGTRATR